MSLRECLHAAVDMLVIYIATLVSFMHETFVWRKPTVDNWGSNVKWTGTN